MAHDATDFVIDAPVMSPERANMHRLRNFLADLEPAKFDMDYPGDPDDAIEGICGTAACIGGWARAILRVRTPGVSGVGPSLGLTRQQTNDLFYPCNKVMGDRYTSAWRATNAQAVAVLDHYLATGKIDWSVA